MLLHRSRRSESIEFSELYDRGTPNCKVTVFTRVLNLILYRKPFFSDRSVERNDLSFCQSSREFWLLLLHILQALSMNYMFLIELLVARIILTFCGFFKAFYFVYFLDRTGLPNKLLSAITFQQSFPLHAKTFELSLSDICCT